MEFFLSFSLDKDLTDLKEEIEIYDNIYWIDVILRVKLGKYVEVETADISAIAVNVISSETTCPQTPSGPLKSMVEPGTSVLNPIRSKLSDISSRGSNMVKIPLENNTPVKVGQNTLNQNRSFRGTNLYLCSQTEYFL